MLSSVLTDTWKRVPTTHGVCHLKNAFCIATAILLAIVPVCQAIASDWEEDSGSGMPPAAPSFRRYSQDNLDRSQGEPGTEKRTAFYVAPRPQRASSQDAKAPLEATVSKWGAGGQLDNNQLGGAAFFAQPEGDFLLPLSAQKNVPPSVFRGWLEKTHPQFALYTSTMNPLNVLEVKGQWDEADRTMRAFGIRHTTIKRGRLTDIPLDDVKVLVVNCAGNVPQEAYQRVRDFVARGGFLISTDWTVHNLVEKAFPGYISWNGGKTENKVVDATVVDMDPALFAGTVARSGWKVDDGSQTIRVLRPSVRILARSRMLGKDDPDHMGILAVSFTFGRGQVLHLVGHFDNNAGLAFTNVLPDPNPVMGISLRQALAANFLISGLNGTFPSRP